MVEGLASGDMLLLVELHLNDGCVGSSALLEAMDVVVEVHPILDPSCDDRRDDF